MGSMSTLVEASANTEAWLVRRHQRVALALWRIWGVCFDLRHRVETTSRIPGPQGEPRDPFVPWFMRWVLPPESVGPSDVFLDVGSGKGRLVLFAAGRYRFARVIGVEVSPEFHRAAVENIRRYRGHLAPIELVNEDVLDWQIPDEVTVIFLYNPFSGATFERCMGEVRQSLAARPREIRLIYANPQEHELVIGAGFTQVRRLGRLRVYGWVG